MRQVADDDPAWVDGRRVRVAEACLALGDPAVQCGLGLFETLALRGPLVLDLDAHLERLLAGAARLGLSAPPKAELCRAALLAARDEPLDTGWLKLVLSGGGQLFVLRGPLDPAEVGRPASAVILPWRRNPADPLAGLKTLNYAANTLGLAYAARHGADEGLWLNTRGRLAEGASSNVFVISRRRVLTPALREGILPGVVRAVAIDAARRLGYELSETRVRLPRLARASEAFLTSSLRGVRALVRVDGRPVGDGSPGGATRRIAEEVERLRAAVACA